MPVFKEYGWSSNVITVTIIVTITTFYHYFSLLHLRKIDLY